LASTSNEILVQLWMEAKAILVFRY